LTVYTQKILIHAPLTAVDRCITEEALMTQWLNPLLLCESLGSWSTEVGSRFRFALRIPFQPSLECQVVARSPGLVEWAFSGFFNGTDRWECFAQNDKTLLVNRFTFEITNPFVRFGYTLVAENLTQRDMQAQLARLKILAEQLKS
jgi:hypothetical protein